MFRLLSAASALALGLGALWPAPIHVVAALGAIGLGLAGVGILTLWRWPVTAAACVFLTDYTLALWLTGSSVSVVGAASFGFGLLVLIASPEVARAARRASVDAGLIRSQIAGWIVFAGATVGTALVVMTLARALALSVPLALAPFVAALAALGIVLALAVSLERAR